MRVAALKIISLYTLVLISHLLSLCTSNELASADCKCGRSPVRRRRVVGGIKSPTGVFPWIAGFIDDAGYNFCGGALVKTNYIVTAAHCFVDKRVKDVIVIIGENDLNRGYELRRNVYKVVRVMMHPHFMPDKWHDDIAVVQVDAMSSDTRTHEAICLPSESRRYFDNLIVAGWGLTSDSENSTKPDELYQVTLPQVDQSYCEQVWSMSSLSPGQMCAGSNGHDTCIYDSGSPLMSRNGSRYTLAGVTSFGSKICGNPLQPGVYTRVSSYLQWINKQTQSHGQC